MPEPITPEIVELILRTSRVKRCDGLYSLAPRGHRVGIYFQQRRATLLAAAIRSRIGREELKKSRIGIIGGGASGLTFLLAIKNEGARNAFLYEAERDILSIGAAASHRLVHPNYNRWPLLGSMDVFTSLPVLNWHSGTADKVIGALKTQAAAAYKELTTDRIKKGYIAKQIVKQDPKYDKPLTVTFETSQGEHKEDFHIVVIAAGFSGERCIEWGCDDYWTRDPGSLDAGEHKRPARIYGAGDGALIDIVRCCAANPDDAWQIPLGTIARIRSEEALTILNAPTGDVGPRVVAFSLIEKKIQTHEESIRCLAWPMTTRSDASAANAYAAEEALFYEGCVDELMRDHGSVAAFLDQHLKPQATEAGLRPVIASPFANPFEPTSAPINKLLLAYLLKTERIVAVRCDRDAAEKELQEWNKLSAAERRTRIVICRFGAAKNFPLGKDKPPTRGVQVTAPAGAGIDISETTNEAHLIDALAGITGGEYVYFDAMPHPDIQARYGLDFVGMTEETRKQNEPILASFAKAHLGARKVAYHGPRKGVGPRWVIMTSLRDEEIKTKLQSVGGWDGNFCGAPIVASRRAGAPPQGNF